MVNGIQLSFFSNYIYNPKIWLHSMSVKHKILMISIYLITIPNIPLYIFSSLTITLSFLFIYLAYKNDSVYFYNILLTLIIYGTLLMCLTNISSVFTSYFIITIPYHITIRWFKNNINVLHYSNRITIWISKLISRMLLLLTSYYLGYQLITLTTQLEDILIQHLSMLHSICKDRFKVCIPDLVFIIILSYEYISLIENTIKNIITSASLRGQSLNLFTNYNELWQMVNLMLHMVNSKLNHEIIATNNIIYSRELHMSSKDKWLTPVD